MYSQFCVCVRASFMDFLPFDTITRMHNIRVGGDGGLQKPPQTDLYCMGKTWLDWTHTNPLLLKTQNCFRAPWMFYVYQLTYALAEYRVCLKTKAFLEHSKSSNFARPSRIQNSSNSVGCNSSTSALVGLTNQDHIEQTECVVNNWWKMLSDLLVGNRKLDTDGTPRSCATLFAKLSRRFSSTWTRTEAIMNRCYVILYVARHFN